VISYASALATPCNLAGTAVQRSSTTQPGAVVTLVGGLATSGTVTAGASVTANGSVRIVATADGTGHLPATLAPKAALSAVVEIAAGDLAVSSIDLSTCAGSAILAPAGATAATTIVDTAVHALAGARGEAVP